ncbi:pyruvate kinase [Artemisia annua]|uniref:pyruvate kinase n=1 Tax=Artemisia annua TaxID=35608 RepID=A0A2U1M212_ARTAN|nr:pyruvate kinase [Artemisia annua]
MEKTKSESGLFFFLANVYTLGVSKRTGWTGPTDKTDRIGPNRTGPITFGPVFGLGFLANSVLGPVGPVRTDQKTEKLARILSNWTGPTEDRTGPNRTGPDRPHSVSVSVQVFALIRSSVLSVRSGPVRVLIPEMTFVGFKSRVLIPETTFVGVKSRVLIPETTFVGVESRVIPETTFVGVESKFTTPVRAFAILPLELWGSVMDTPEDVVFKIHHGGVFFFDPLRYEQGQVTIMNACSTNMLMFNELCNILVDKLKDKIWAIFCCIPELDIDGGGLMIIERDSDLQVVYDMAKKHDKLDLYVAHEPKLLAEYYYQNLCLEGSDEEVTSARKEHEIKKKHAGNMPVEELVAWAEEEAKSPYLRSPPKKSTPVRNGFKGKALFAGTYDEYDTGCDIPVILDDNEVGQEDLLGKSNDLENEVQSLPKDNVVVDQVDNVVEEHRVDEHRVEVEEHRVDEHRVDVKEPSIDVEVLARQKTFNRKRKSTPRGTGIRIRENDGPLSSNSDSDDSEMGDQYGHYSSETESHDSDKSFDYLSDIEDEVIELRKRKLESKEHTDEVIDDLEPPGYDDMVPSLDHVSDTFGETVREHEHCMEALMRKLKGNGEGVSDPFVMVEKPYDKYPIYDDQTHWRLKKPKLGEKYVNSDQFREALTYYALANGFSLWYEKSTKQMIISKCGQRKETLKDPSKGKQRNFHKYPSCSQHTCVRNFNYGRVVTYKWIGRNFGDKIRMNPKITIAQMQELVMKKYQCRVSSTQCLNAKKYALSEGEAAIQDHYGREEIIRTCRSMGKAVIVATNMLESMIVHPTPTRAEVSDIAIAVREGADAVMLSGETAHGKFPLKAVNVMHTVSLRTESSLMSGGTASSLNQAFKNHMSEMFAYHATSMSNTLGTSIVVFTRTSTMAVLLSHYRPNGTIFAFTDDKRVQQKLALYQGVCPIYMKFSDDAEATFANALTVLKNQGMLKEGELVALLQSGRQPIWRFQSTHNIQSRFHFLRDEYKSFFVSVFTVFFVLLYQLARLPLILSSSI